MRASELNRTSNQCPYCAVVLNPIPKRRCDCAGCGNHIRPRQGFLYTEAALDAYLERASEAPSNRQLALMFNLGMHVPRGCTEKQASIMLDEMGIDDEPTDEQRHTFVNTLRAISSRLKGGKETIDDIIADPPISRILQPASNSAGCATIFLVFLIGLWACWKF